MKRIVPVMTKATSAKRTASGEAKMTCLGSLGVWEKANPENGAFFCGRSVARNDSFLVAFMRTATRTRMTAEGVS